MNKINLLLPLMTLQFFAENKVSFGLKKVHYAPYEIVDGVPVFEKPVAYPGAVEITNDPRGETTEFPADDSTYFVKVSNEGYEGSYTSAEQPEHFRINVLGETKVNGLLVENKNAKIKPVALLFEFDGDVKATRHALLGVNFTRPSFGSKTKEGAIEVNQKELSYIATGIGDITKVSTSSTTSAEIYDDWFEEVQYEAMTVPAAVIPET